VGYDDKLGIIFNSTATVKVKQPVTNQEGPRVFQEVKIHRFHDNGTGW